MEGYTFVNWAGTQTSHPELYFEPSSVDEIKEIIRKAKEEGKRVKVQGYGHSPNDIACSDGYMMYLKKMTDVINVNKEKLQITVQAGCSIKALAVDILPKYNMALPVCPAVGEPTIAGAISCGTHATGKKFGVLGSYVIALKLITADGEVLNCSKEENGDIFRAAVCSLGCLGVILEVTLQCHEAFQLHSISKPSTLDEILSRVDTFLDEYDHAKFFWYPHTEKVIVYHDNRTEDQPVKNPFSWFWDRLIGHHLHQFSMWIGCTFPSLQGLVNHMFFNLLCNFVIERVDTSYNLFTYHCLYSQEVTDWSIPVEKTADVFRELRASLIMNPDIGAHFPVEARFVKGDNGMVSPCHGRDSCFINIVHFRPYGMDTSNKKYWDLFQDIVKRAGGRPHWAKVHDVTSKDFSKMYPEWDKFCAIREGLDPDGMFLNDHLERIFEVKKDESKKES
ncbi:L-gulonolactone oxidase [Holothuria leucospilota]|uniref:L-gulonolactone oxidase n=1 Tax=Holothuria leucospilota TaxID=206669 RepID=A0A9Q0YD03_HOLLE|nr:L-gulonolactone oxidase [Holothuria leucospilota]